MKYELLAPAGNIEKMKTAFAHGADAVYLGIPDFSLRVRINDFDFAGIEEATVYAHRLKKKVYVTVNIFAHNRHLAKLSAYIRKLRKIAVDALIVSDPGILNIIHKEWPRAEIHLSTQANCTNWQSAKFWFDQGARRVILGREVTLAEIREIHKKVPKLELEYFIHGAMCMAYSGRCFLSKEFMNKSGNLGDCAQPCRWKYYISEEKRLDQPMELVQEEHGSYLLNSRDLCLIEHIEDLMKAGVTSFKIEGRAKSVYYIAVVTGIYRKALDLFSSPLRRFTPCLPEGRLVYSVFTGGGGLVGDLKSSPSAGSGQAQEMKKLIKRLKKELETKLMHRGYTEGFLLGGGGEQNTEGAHIKSEWEFCGTVVESPKFVKSKVNKGKIPFSGGVAERSEDGVGSFMPHVRVHNTLKVGDLIEIVKPGYDIVKMKLKSMADAKTGEELEEAHGGGKTIVVIEVKEFIPEFSVLRRKIV